MAKILDFIKMVYRGKTLRRIVFNWSLKEWCKSFSGTVVDFGAGSSDSLKKWLPEVKNFNKQVEEIVSDDTKKTFAEWQKIFEEENSKKKKSNKLTKSQKKAKKEAIQQKANETRQRNLLALQEKKNKKPIDFVGGETYTTVGEFYIQSFDDSIPW